jgi:hypothetical protein
MTPVKINNEDKTPKVPIFSFNIKTPYKDAKSMLASLKDATLATLATPNPYTAGK